MEPPLKVPKLDGMTDTEINTVVAKLLGNRGLHDILAEVVKQLDIESIDRLCRVNWAFKDFCENYKDTGVWQPVFYHKAGDAARDLLSAVEPVLRLPTIYGKPRAKINWKWMVFVTTMIQQLNTVRDPAPPGKRKPRRMNCYALLLLPHGIMEPGNRIDNYQVAFTAQFARGIPDDELYDEFSEISESEWDARRNEEHYNLSVHWSKFFPDDISAFIMSIVMRWARDQTGFVMRQYITSRKSLIEIPDYRNDVLVRILYDMFQEGFAYPILSPEHVTASRKAAIEKGKWGQVDVVPEGSYGIRQQVNDMSLCDFTKPTEKSPWDY